MSYVFDEVRAQVPKISLDEVFLAKEEIALAIKTELKKSMSGFEYQIIQTLITDTKQNHFKTEPDAIYTQLKSFTLDYLQFMLLFMSSLVTNRVAVLHQRHVATTPRSRVV